MSYRSIPSFSRPLVAALVALAAGCGDPAAPLVPGVVLSVAIDSTGGPLARALTVRLDRPAPVTVTWGATGTPVLALDADSASAEHRIVLPRLRAQKGYTLEVGVTRGESPPVRTTFGTGALPPDVAALRFEVTGQPTLPVSLIEVVGGTKFFGLLVVEEGQVVGYLQMPQALFGSTRRANGNVVLLDSELGLLERGFDGTLVRRLPQPETDATAKYGHIHHDVTATPRNTLLFIANDTRNIDGTNVVGEALWEWTPEAGTVVKRWTAFDHLDWRTERGSRTTASNWLHGNGIAFGPRGNVLMSLRNVDQVLSIAPDFSRVEWKLGGVNGTLAVAAADRFYGQHYISEPSPDHLLVFDNGFERPGGGFTRVIEFAIDTRTSTATRVWQYRHAPEIYAPLVGSARRLANGNTVALFGMIGGQTGSSGPLTAVEVDPAGTVKWRMGFGPELTRLYRLTPVASLLGEREGRFASAP